MWVMFFFLIGFYLFIMAIVIIERKLRGDDDEK